MTVRPATEDDLSAILAIVNGEIAAGWAHFSTEPVARAEIEADFRATREWYPWLVAEAEGRVAAYAKAYPWKPRGAYRWTCEIGVYVEPSMQGRGLGRALYAELFPRLTQQNFRTVIAGIALPNPASVRLHESFGMTRAGVIDAAGFKHGAWRDVGYWQMRLGRGDGEPGELMRCEVS